MPLRLLDTTIRAEWEAGRDPDQLPADADRGGLTDAAWHNRARTGLPNGLCGLPRQQTCDHSNKCLTCPVFITTSSDLPAHEEHRRRTLTLITQLEDRGQTRLADQNRAVPDHRGDRGAGQDRQQALDTGGQLPGCSTTASTSGGSPAVVMSETVGKRRSERCRHHGVSDIVSDAEAQFGPGVSPTAGLLSESDPFSTLALRRSGCAIMNARSRRGGEHG